MASTQTLTELPSIHYTGMDYETVVSQIKEIIENNSNWAENWTQFYNSEAGTMLIQLMAWICDTLGVRQDLLYNEMFMATATTDTAKRRLLNYIGYTRKSATAATVPISVQFDDVQTSDINLSNVRDDESDLSSIIYNIYRFYGKDKNGSSRAFEILDTNSDGTINYTKSVKLSSGLSYYTESSEGKQLKAVEGTTVYREFTSDTNDGPSFVLEDENIDLKTLVVYDVTNNQNLLHQRVENFLDLNVLNGTNICYTITMNDKGYYQINYPTLDIVTYGSEILEDRLFTAGNTIGVLYRTTNGALGNISANYFSVEDSVTDVNSETHGVTIKNTLAASGGRDAESLTAALKNYTQSIKTMNRAITITDYDTLLKQNELVLNCKSYSPDNMPSKFKKYFGRRINPQEIFSFVLLNKATDDIPSDRLNYYPWIELNKDQILNEKYVFGDAVLNEQHVAANVGGLNIYIKDYINDDLEKKLLTREDDGSDYYDHYNFTLDDEQYKAIQLPNATLYKTGDIFGSYIKQELLNIQNDVSDPCFLKIKFSSNISSENYVKNMTNTFLDSKENLMTNNNIIEEETNAVYNSANLISITDSNYYKYIKFVLDDNLKFTIDLQAEKDGLDLISGSEYGVTDDEFEDYYLKFYNAPGNTEKDELEAKKAEYAEDDQLWIDYKNSEAYANYRKGIVQQIEDQIEKHLSYLGEKNVGTVYSNIDQITGEGYSLIKEYNKTKLYRKTDSNGNDSYLLTDYSTNGIIPYNISSIGQPEFSVVRNVDLQYDSSQDAVIRNKLADGTSAYIDLGLQAENYNSGDYLLASYYSTVDNTKSSLQVTDVYKYYRIKINGEIYALRIDGYTANLAIDFYNQVATNTGGIKTYNDYYPYIGVGILEPGSNINFTDYYGDGSQWLQFLKSGTRAYSKATINASVVSTNYKTGMVKQDQEGIGGSTEGTLTYVSFTVEQLAAVLEYLLSEFNNNEGTIYKYNDGEWVDIKKETKKGKFSDYNILDGKLRVCAIEKDNFGNNQAVNLPIQNSNVYYSGKEYDIRFECFNMDDDKLEISSVSEEEISVENSSNETVPIEIDDQYFETEDLIQSIFSGYLENPDDIYQDLDSATKYNGQRRSYSAEKINYVDDGAEGIFSYSFVDEDNETGYISFKSKATGKNSSIYFIQTAENSSEEFMSYAGLYNSFYYSYNNNSDYEYIDRAKSEKALGIKKVELIISENDLNAFYGPDNDALQAIGSTDTSSDYATLETGDILITDNDINHSSLSTLYFSYILSDTSKMLLNQRNNFYYTSDEALNEAAKPPIVCIEGAAVKQDDEGNYYIDNNKSKFDVRLTADEQDTNSLYAISDDTYSELETIKIDRVGVELNSIPKMETANTTTSTGYNPYYSPNGIGYGFLDEPVSNLNIIEDYEIPLVYSIDGYTNNIPSEEKFEYYIQQNSVIAINPGTLASLNSATICSKLQAFLKGSENEDYADNYYSMIKQKANDTNKFTIYNLLPTGDGNITFYYPASANEYLYINTEAKLQADNEELYRLACKIFYLHLFGTNITNPEFYNLYPKDEMTSYSLNASDVVVKISDDEYFYCPTDIHPLKFVYRTFTSDDKSESKFGDFYITAEPKNSEMENFAGGYDFYLNKTSYANFPDINFYVHYINDRTYEYQRTNGTYQTEEDVLSNYMDQYRITGMDSYFIKPYFKTFDIVGTVNYNANYDVSTVKSNIESALKAKYSIKNISDFTIGKEIYRSDVFKTVLGVEGVESFQLEYFGYNNSDQDNNPDQKYVLTTGASDSTTTDDFYIIPVLHDTTSNRGIVLSYVKVATSSIYSN